MLYKANLHALLRAGSLSAFGPSPSRAGNRTLCHTVRLHRVHLPWKVGNANGTSNSCVQLGSSLPHCLCPLLLSICVPSQTMMIPR